MFFERTKVRVHPMEEIQRLLKDLIRFKTMHNHPEAMHRCMAFIVDYFNQFDIPTQLSVYGDSPSLLIMPDNYSVPILLMSHIDVVDAPEALFNPVVRDGKLYGRGSIDDKYAVALSMVLLKSLLTRQREPENHRSGWPLGLLITSDEEIGGLNGAARRLTEIKADFAVVLDGGSFDQIVVKEKGILRVKLKSRGKTAHGARPWLGENAIENLFEDYQALKRIFPQNRDDHWQRTLNFSIVHAGKSPNQVPDRAEALFDIRYTEDENVDALVKSIRDTVRGEVVVEAVEPVFQSGDSPDLELLLKIAPGIRTGCSHGASDARFLAKNGIPGIVWGADGDLSQHTVDEHVDLESIDKLYQCLHTFIEKSAEMSA